MHGRGHALQGGMHGRGACVAWQGDMHDMCGRGAYMAWGQGHAWRGGVHGRGCVAGETAIAAGGTHPTEMHSCFRHLFIYSTIIVAIHLWY